MAGSDHHFSQGIHCQQLLSVYFEKPVCLGRQLYFAFFYFRLAHVFILTDIPENLGPLIFMEDSLCLFPYIQMLFAH